MVISKKKVFDLPQTDLSVSFERPYEAIGPSDEPHDGPPKLHGPRGHCPPLPPPLGGPDVNISNII